ncbi:MAG: hypothetical protein HYX80_09210 [Chloroflexi bacterium]|nr:hypothetical protein [Chloroflexota bacterium]
MPYVAELEKAGIPTVTIDLADQDEMLKQTALTNGVPNVRFIHASRTLPGPEDVSSFAQEMLDALTRPLTKKEKDVGRYEPPQPRVLFEGTLDEAETFYQQTRHIPAPLNAPISIYTDGLPIRVPTEERVKEMLKGTSHRPDEIISYQADATTFQSDITGTVGLKVQRQVGDPVFFQPMMWTATVEKVATIAVMAGCKPEHLPVVLAIAESACPTGTTVAWSQWACVSGPYAKEIGMNSGIGLLDPGSPANMPIGRAYQLMAINLGGAVPGINRMNSIGSPFNSGGTCFAENADGLPPGWKGLNEEYGYRKDQSVVMVMNGSSLLGAGQFSPGGYRAFQKSGHGGLARRLDVKGTPGPHNWLEYLSSSLWAGREGGVTFIMVPEMARHLYDYGFKSKEDIYRWLYDKAFESLGDFRNRSWPDLNTNGWMGIEKTSGKHWKELPDDYRVPLIGDPFDNCIIVAGGDEEVCTQIAGRHASPSPVYSIDAWR